MRAIALAAGAAVALVGVYLALGGASYAPAAVADPCTPRPLRNVEGFERVAEQVVLSALDGAACELGVSLERFTREHGGSEERLEKLVRAGLVRALDDAEHAHRLDPTLADLLRGLVARIPVAQLLDLLEQLPGR